MFGELFSSLMDQAPTIGAALVAGAIVGRVGKSERTGPLPLNKVGSPIAAIATAAIVEVVRAGSTGEPYDLATVARAGGELGGVAILGHTLAKNGVQFWTAVRNLRRERREQGSNLR